MSNFLVNCKQCQQKLIHKNNLYKFLCICQDDIRIIPLEDIINNRYKYNYIIDIIPTDPSYLNSYKNKCNSMH